MPQVAVNLCHCYGMSKELKQGGSVSSYLIKANTKVLVEEVLIRTQESAVKVENCDHRERFVCELLFVIEMALEFPMGNQPAEVAKKITQYSTIFSSNTNKKKNINFLYYYFYEKFSYK